MKKDIVGLEKLNWKKNWAGVWSLLECCDFGREYTKLIPETYGKGPVHTLFLIENGNSSNYLVPDEIADFTDILVKKMRTDDSLAEQWAKEIMVQADRVLQFVREENPAFDKSEYEKLWDLSDAYLKVHFPIKKIVDYLSPELLQKSLPILEKARVYAEPVYAESLEYVKRFAAAHAEKYGLTRDEFLAMTRDEFDEAMSGGLVPDKAILDERNKFSLLVVVHGEVVEVLHGDAARSLTERTVHKLKDVNELKGATAFPGRVTGRVIVVKNPGTISTLPPGSVLVTGMTRPDYIHLFKSATAVVTDAGGVLSHAAITARELKIPTVIGTEVATKVLNDGDVVEVDADNGIVRILKTS
jgi:phosphohistidine swiveling domain-containing protein